jgi:hypothetical protein
MTTANDRNSCSGVGRDRRCRPPPRAETRAATRHRRRPPPGAASQGPDRVPVAVQRGRQSRRRPHDRGPGGMAGSVGNLSFESQCGFGGADSMRRSFLRTLRVTPTRRGPWRARPLAAAAGKKGIRTRSDHIYGQRIDHLSVRGSSLALSSARDQADSAYANSTPGVTWFARRLFRASVWSAIRMIHARLHRLKVTIVKIGAGCGGTEADPATFGPEATSENTSAMSDRRVPKALGESI